MILFGWVKQLSHLKRTDNNRVVWPQQRKARCQEISTDAQVSAQKAEACDDLTESCICEAQISQGHCKGSPHCTLQWNDVVEALCVKTHPASSLLEKFFSSHKQRSSSDLLMLAI